jgi:hypothetical protein
MARPRAWHTATLLADGRVLIAGGSTAAWTTGGALDSAEIYDPSTGTFTVTGSMVDPRTFHAATLLTDGRVLLTGGNDGAREDVTTAELYDPVTARFAATGVMGDGRQFHTATQLPDGRVLVAGGGADYVNTAFIASAELYDPVTGTFSLTGSVADARTNHVATLLGDGRVLLTGGYGATAPLPYAELFDVVSGTFSPAGSGG